MITNRKSFLFSYLDVTPSFKFTRNTIVTKKARIQLSLSYQCCSSLAVQSSTLRRMNLKTEVSLWEHIKCFASTPCTPEEFKNALITPGHRSFWICVWGNLSQGNHVIIETPLFLKSSVFKMFSVQTKTESQSFQFLRFKDRFWKAFETD